MEARETSVTRLQSQIASLEGQLASLKAQLARAERTFDGSSAAVDQVAEAVTTLPGRSVRPNESTWTWPLKEEQYQRYGRQLLVPQVGLQGQLSLQSAKVLVVGLGGLGCPAAAYLAGAGIGTLGLVDGDTVELSNLHRQILHTTNRIGKLKVDSALESLERLNPLVRYVKHREHLAPGTAVGMLEAYDLILDCTDHPTSRYLISDAAVLTGKPLVSASALRTEGQLMVLNDPPRSNGSSVAGPCYRCVFPRPPSPESVTSCGDGGILGPVVGLMGVLMALEAIKIVASWRVPSSGASGPAAPSSMSSPMSIPASSSEAHASMLLFSAYSSPSFRSVKLRGRRANCFACGDQTTLTRDSLTSGALDYTTFCGISPSIGLLGPSERITATALQQIQVQHPTHHVLLDVRDATEFELCHLPNSINLPLAMLKRSKHRSINIPSSSVDTSKDSNLETVLQVLGEQASNAPIYTICRRGQDSQVAVRELLAMGYGHDGARWIGDVLGGLQAWKKEVDPSWPEY